MTLTPEQLREKPNTVRLRSGVQVVNGITGETGPTFSEYVLLSDYEELQRAHAVALEEVSRIERLVYVPGAWKCAKCNLRLITTTLDAGSGRMAADCSPQECANGCGPMWRVTERDAGNDLVDRLDRAEAALAESERRCERLKGHADRMRQILTIGDGGFPCRAVADYDAEFKGE